MVSKGEVDFARAAAFILVRLPRPPHVRLGAADVGWSDLRRVEQCATGAVVVRGIIRERVTGGHVEAVFRDR
eukprot:6813089-Pyramimonas_sp.AAC.1